MPATTTRTLAWRRSSERASRRCRPATPTSYKVRVGWSIIFGREAGFLGYRQIAAAGTDDADEPGCGWCGGLPQGQAACELVISGVRETAEYAGCGLGADAGCKHVAARGGEFGEDGLHLLGGLALAEDDLRESRSAALDDGPHRQSRAPRTGAFPDAGSPRQPSSGQRPARRATL